MHEPKPIRRHERVLHAGFIPLLDCAPLVIARECGFDQQFGFSFQLHREVSWANIRDKLDVGVFDCAHMLAPMPIAATLGLGRATEPVIAPMSLSLNGNAITVSKSLFDEMCRADEQSARAGGMAPAKALAQVVRVRNAEGGTPLTFGMVYPFSCHNYDLRAWLAAAGIDPDNDINLVVVPPPLIAEQLKAGRVDGFCVGQPWNSVAVEDGQGVIVATKNQIWPLSPEKVLGVREEWAEGNAALLSDAMRALAAACAWLDEPDNRVEAAKILAAPHYVGVSEHILEQPLTGHLKLGGETPDIADPDCVVFNRYTANFPWRSHAVWIIMQMIRWGQVRDPFDILALAERVYRPDVYRAALAGSGIEIPDRDCKPEGQDGGFFGDAHFDPEDVIGLLKALPIRTAGADLEAFAEHNL
ncbi:CmpA/NrtA family ABC transporter substrate-binding protein [Methyloceanibacter sp. wino2]|uniref:CmpA/NrtA family ABC transporter substrate-binding protein n=1 Tax=Methyloceanibacter sp. wino2 TaxID=2170729 RepID=UPI000D3E157D|nr:CmpA/NrtA family ABC transporter substrate-binding protein [Methyloceanibacter sp. wino2]